MLSVPDNSILAGGAWFACTVTLGTAVAEPPVEGTAVACEAEVEPLFDAGVSVADEPHANNKMTNNRTIAFGIYLRLNPDISEALLKITFCVYVF
tara:strand:+ start:822 stop:1106 length:285 start_codon:yes stop_codon:yes gene_type:complete